MYNKGHVDHHRELYCSEHNIASECPTWGRWVVTLKEENQKEKKKRGGTGKRGEPRRQEEDPRWWVKWSESTVIFYHCHKIKAFLL